MKKLFACYIAMVILLALSSCSVSTNTQNTSGHLNSIPGNSSSFSSSEIFSDTAGLSSGSLSSHPIASDISSAPADSPVSSKNPTSSAVSSNKPASSAVSSSKPTSSAVSSNKPTSSAVSSSRPTSSAASSNSCKHYVVVGDIYMSVREDISTDTTIGWKCTQCGASEIRAKTAEEIEADRKAKEWREQRERDRLSRTLLPKAFANGTTPAELNERDLAVLKAARSIKSKLPKNYDDFDVVYACANWMYDHCKYDYEALKKYDDLQNIGLGSWAGGGIAYTYEGVFLKGLAVCSGYTDAFSLLMELFNIPCEEVTGTANNGSRTDGHAWNLVQVGGIWYHVDTTWGSNYFMLSDAEIGKNHNPEKQAHPAPQSLPIQYIKRIHQVPDENYKINPDAIPDTIRQQFFTGATTISFLIEGDYTLDLDAIFFGSLTAEERQNLRSYSHTKKRFGSYTLIRVYLSYRST